MKFSMNTASISRDGRQTVHERMEAALLVRHDPKAFGNLLDKGREFMGMTLLDLAKESLAAQGVNTRGMGKDQLAASCLRPERFDGAQTSTDFPSVLANVANKSMRKAYEAWPQTYRAFCRQVTAPDFKDINRPQLSDAPALQQLNERGEYHRANLTDQNQNYKLATFGEIISISRKAIVNDDQGAFTRIPALLGVAAAQTESNTAWGVITSNPVMQADGLALFQSAKHNNLFTGAGSALGLTNLGTARAAMRTQKAPGGTPLNLVPRFLAVPAALETTALQLCVPIGIASTAVSGVVPEWVRSLVPIVESRLDTASTTAWYLFADPAQIDTVEYAYLEGQEGVYLEPRQGFETDGMEFKARLDFGACALDYRGMQKNAGA
jgi:hypothetical protein